MTYSHSVRINPPLVITEDEALTGLGILDEAIGVVARQHGVS
jgi:4-aminobutyrate aminotransferase-like enzyme